MPKPILIDMTGSRFWRSGYIFRAPMMLRALVGIVFAVGLAALSIAGVPELARLSPLASLYGHWTTWHSSHGCSRTIDA